MALGEMRSCVWGVTSMHSLSSSTAQWHGGGGTPQFESDFELRRRSKVHDVWLSWSRDYNFPKCSGLGVLLTHTHMWTLCRHLLLSVNLQRGYFSSLNYALFIMRFINRRLLHCFWMLMHLQKGAAKKNAFLSHLKKISINACHASTPPLFQTSFASQTQSWFKTKTLVGSKDTANKQKTCWIAEKSW